MGTVGQEFGQGRAGWLISVTQCLGSQLEELKSRAEIRCRLTNMCACWC